MQKVSAIAVGIAQACELCGVGRTTLYAAIASGELPARKVGRRTLIITAELEAWLTSRPGFALPALTVPPGLSKNGTPLHTTARQRVAASDLKEVK